MKKQYKLIALALTACLLTGCGAQETNATQNSEAESQTEKTSNIAAEIDEAWDSQERVLVQGIIDAYFLEGDEIVLVDYKTDRVRRGEEQKLVDLYHTQLEDYAQALQRMTGRRVKEKYIYSFTLKKEILLL